MNEAGGKGIRRVWRFIVEGVWDIEPSSLSAVRRFGVNTLRVLSLVIKGFREDECPLHASSLTFSTLMAIVPILALALSLARVFGGDDLARDKIKSVVADWTRSFATSAYPARIAGTSPSHERQADGNTRREIPLPSAASSDADGVSGITPEELAARINEIVDRAFEKVANISFAALGGVGLILLLWMVISVLGRVESAFNKVWGVTAGRSLWRKFTDYLSVVLILPFLAVAASSLPVADLVSQILDESTAQAVRASVGSGAFKGLMVILMTSLCFAFVIMFMPNTRVKPLPGFAGGLVAALLFIGWLWLCATVQIGVAKYGKIYGGFAVVPIVLAWVYVSWEIVLLGAEAAFAFQNCATYRMEQGARKASARARTILALSVLIEAGRAMLGKSRHFETAAYALEKRVPVRFLNDVVDELARVGFLAETAGHEGRFVLLRSPSDLRIKEVLDALANSGVAPEALGVADIEPRARDVIAGLRKNLDEYPANASIRDLIKESSQ